MAGPDLAKFQRIIEAARARSTSLESDTLIPQAHLSQMRLFMLRQGVEFFPRQDSFSTRREFIKRVVDYNKLPSRLDAVVDSFLIDGLGLLYFRPSKDLYRVHYFRHPQYRSYYDEDGDWSSLTLIYSFKVKPKRGGGISYDTESMTPMSQNGMGFSNQNVRWLKLVIRADRIEQRVSIEKPNFDEDVAGRMVSMVNPMGFVPAVEVFNNRSLVEGEGYGEFDWLAGHILEHDRMTRSVKANLHFFGSPTLVSSRPKHDLIEPDEEGNTKQRATIASQSGFTSMNRPSTRVSEPGYGGGGLRVPRIIANVEASDRVQFITPDAVAGDLTSFTAMYQEMIRAAMGGVDDLSINSGATAYEVRTVYGRVAATAKSKCKNLFDYGYCLLFQMMITYEETLFKESLAQALGLIKPEPPLEENMPPEQFPRLQAMYMKERDKWTAAVGNAIASIKQTGQVPPQLIGLVPDGDTSILWRWQGEVFEDSKQEILQSSIVCRNMQELGVDSLEALAYLFPAKTPEERAAMLGGFPFRISEATQRSIGITIDTIRALFQTPHPQEPDMPLAADPNLDMTPFLYRTLQHLRTELNYGGRFSDSDPIGVPDTLDDADRLRAALGLPTGASRRADERRAAFAAESIYGGMGSGSGSAYTRQLGFDGQSMGPGVPGTGGRSNYADAPAFGSTGTLDFDPTDPEFSAGGELGLSNARFSGGMGEPDFAAPTNAGIPMAGAAAPGGARSGGPATSGNAAGRPAGKRRAR